MGKTSKIRSLFRRRRSKSTPPPSAAGASSDSVSGGSSSGDEMERVFRKFDANGDGRISSSELAAIFESLGQPASPEEVARMMAEADADGDGFISLEEFADINAAASLAEDDADEDLRCAFSVFDLDRNGAISAEELARVMRGIGESATVAQCRRMIDGVDRDGDGLVSFEEFRAMMTAPSNKAAAAAFAGLAKAAAK